MRKAILAVVISAICSGVGFAESMAGKIGFGLRNETFEVRYFASDRLGVHAGGAMDSEKTTNLAKDTDYDLHAGGFYSKEIGDGIMFQAGLTVQYNTGRKAGYHYDAWGANPYLGAEMVFKGRFGIDFKVILVQYTNIKVPGADRTTTLRSSGTGNFGAHLYF